MSDIVLRLRHCSDNCGDEYLRELSGRAADEIERLKAELLERDAVWLPEKDAEITRLRAALGEIAKTTYGYEPFMPDEEAKEYFKSRFFGAQAKARAALKEDGDE